MKKLVVFLIVVIIILPLSAVYHKIGDYDTPGSVSSVFVTNNIAYIAEEDWGLHIIDVSNPQNPALLGSYDTPGNAQSVCVSNNIAYVADGGSGLQIIDVSNPQNPTLLGSYDTPYWACSVFVSNNIAYVADGEWGLQIIDVSNPQNPAFLGSYDTPGYARSVTVSNNIAYVADSGTGLQIIDVSNPQNPALLGSYNTPGSAFSIPVSNNIAYVAVGSYGLKIIDVSNPAAPVLLNTILPRPTSVINKCIISDNLLIISDTKWNELSFYHINNPAAPEFVCRYCWNLSTDDMVMQNGYLYTCNGCYGLYILDMNQVMEAEDSGQLPSITFNLKNYPNPFNPETTISFEISKPGNIVLNVYNLKGELVKRLINNQMSNGKHSIVWDGKDNKGKICSSGVYFYKIESNGRVETKKMLLMK